MNHRDGLYRPAYSYC